MNWINFNCTKKGEYVNIWFKFQPGGMGVRWSMCNNSQNHIFCDSLKVEQARWKSSGLPTGKYQTSGRSSISLSGIDVVYAITISSNMSQSPYWCQDIVSAVQMDINISQNKLY